MTSSSPYPPVILRDAGVFDHEQAYEWWRTPNANLGDRTPLSLWWSGVEGTSAMYDEASRALVRAEVQRLTGAAT